MEHVTSDLFTFVAECLLAMQAVIAQRLTREQPVDSNDEARPHANHAGRVSLVDAPLDTWPTSGVEDARRPTHKMYK